MTLSREHCQQLDTEDSLQTLREHFVLPAGEIYLDGNSLGARPVKALARAREVVEQEWGNRLIRSWNEAGWWNLPVTVGDKIGQLLGAEPGEVILTDTIGVNLYKVLSAALNLLPERRVIVMEGSNFPTDNYIASGLIEQLGGAYEIKFVEEDQLAAAINEDVAVVCLTQVHYRTGRVLDMAAITALTQAVGAISIWDLSHSAGALEVDLNGCNADFAVGCTYKYLNGGPGSPAFVFCAARHQGKALQPLTGWWGHAEPFAFEPDYRPAPDIRQMLCGTQSAISMAIAEVGVDIFLTTSMAAVQAKSRALTTLFIDLLDQRCSGLGFEVDSPRDASKRGSQVALSHEQGYAIMQALIARGVIGDFRAPHTLRFGFAPLYLRHTDVWDAVEILMQIMKDGAWQNASFEKRNPVT